MLEALGIGSLKVRKDLATFDEVKDAMLTLGASQPRALTQVK